VGTVIGVIVGAVVTVLASRYYFYRSTNKSLGVYQLLNSFVFTGIGGNSPLSL
jgi:ABC-type branched-subunit amino acid transport system permease subunit